jgi:hypothetical protein
VGTTIHGFVAATFLQLILADDSFSSDRRISQGVGADAGTESEGQGRSGSVKSRFAAQAMGAVLGALAVVRLCVDTAALFS